MSIHILVQQGKVKEVIAMLKADHSLINSTQDKTKQTPMHIAVNATNLEMVIELAKFKPDISILDAIEYNILDCIIYSAHDKYNDLDIKFEIIKILITECKVDINYRSTTDSFHYLQRAILYKQFKLTRLLLMLGANCQLPDLHHKRPIDIVADPINNLTPEWWALLLEYGAGINIDFGKLDMGANKENAIALLTEVTKDKVIIGSKWLGKPITRDTPGFKWAITNFNKLLEALNRKVVLNQTALILTVSKYLRSHNNEDLRKMIRHFKLYNAETTSLKEIVAANILLNKMVPVDTLEALPIELKEHLLTVDTSIIRPKNIKKTT